LRHFFSAYFSASPPQPFARIPGTRHVDPGERPVPAPGSEKTTDLCTLHSALCTVCSNNLFVACVLYTLYPTSIPEEPRAACACAHTDTRHGATLMRHVALAVAEPLP